MASLPQLPPECSLFVATPQTVHLRSLAAGNRILFECETPNGVVNAKASRDNSSLIAIADSQVVILHDTKRGSDREYKLQKSDVSRARVLPHNLLAEDNPGRTTAATVLTRFAYPLLHDYPEHVCSSLLYSYSRTPPIFTAASFAPKHSCHFTQWPCPYLGFASATHHIPPGPTLGSQRTSDVSAD